MKPWPGKEERETWELNAFCDAWGRGLSRQFVPISRGDRPDAIVRDQATGDKFGVELTSVYLDDRSVPDRHRVAKPKVKAIPYDQSSVQAYMLRILAAIEDKAEKARKNYDLSLPLILSIYINEYESIHISKKEMATFFEVNSEVLDRCQIISEIVLWCGSGVRCRIRPGRDPS